MPLRKKLFRTIREKKAQFFSAWFLIVISSIVFYSFTAAGANLIDPRFVHQQRDEIRIRKVAIVVRVLLDALRKSSLFILVPTASLLDNLILPMLSLYFILYSSLHNAKRIQIFYLYLGALAFKGNINLAPHLASLHIG